MEALLNTSGSQHGPPNDLSDPLRHPRWLWFDRAVCFALAIYGVAVLLTLLAAPHFFLPAEDAVILHQYSRNLAEQGAITYYAGGPHAEGATDFAWMGLIAAGIRCGISPPVFTAVINFSTLLVLGLVMLRLAGLRITALRLLMIAGAAGLLPQIVAAAGGFAILPDALLLTLLAVSFARQRATLAAALGLVLCLFRPDGVVFVVPLLVCLLLRPDTRSARALRILLVFVLPGLAYFVWRMAYFHALFPLPFTVKSDVHRTLGVVVPHSFTSSLKYLFFDGALLLPLLWPGWVSRLRAWPPGYPLQPNTVPLAISLLGVPTLFYWAMRLDQNVGDRFFFYLPLAAALLLALNWSALDDPRRRLILRIGCAAFLVFLLGPLLREFRSFRYYQFRDVQAIAADLRRLPARGTLLTTEAGFITYGSGWVAYDAWGLNTERFAHRLVQPSDVVALHPDLIVLHPDPPESCLPQPAWLPAYTLRSWPDMTRNLILGARDAGDYQLWLISYGSSFYRDRKHWRYGEGDRECFLVRESSPLFAGMVAVLKQHNAVGPPQSIALERSHRDALDATPNPKTLQ
jgi:hypothetical protein